MASSKNKKVNYSHGNDSQMTLYISFIIASFILVSQECWCRLIDNLLFYSKTAEQWSEIKGVIALEKCLVRSITKDEQGHWPFQLS
jgi:hypothetical protein